MLIESDQALFRADHYNFPKEIWSVKTQKWEPYKGRVPKEIGWGDIVSDDEAEQFKRPI